MARRIRDRLGTIAFALIVIALAGLVAWNVFGQGPFGDSCHISLGCKSFLCVHHELAGSAQVETSGRCTKSCERDDECGAGARCVVLGDDARSDLPPFGKPERACLWSR